MDRKKLLIAGSLTGIIIVLLSIGLLISPNSVPIKNLTSTNSTDGSFTENGLIFDNSTPESTAISIARLNEGAAGFGEGNGIITNASLTQDRQYWIVNMHEDGYNEWIVTIDTKTLMSKKNGGIKKFVNTWRSLDELKANFIAEIQSGSGIDFDRPYKITLDKKTVWKVPVYNIISDKRELYGYIYVDLTTGKSKNVDLRGKTEGWKTLKEIDDSINEMYDVGPRLFKDALRGLYSQ